MKKHETDATLRSWANARGDRPAPADLRQRILDIPFDETPPQPLWPWGGKGFDMYSAAKLVAAAALVALFVGLLAPGCSSTEPTEREAPVAVPTGSPETTTEAPTAAPTGTRVEVTEDSFAITFPPGWTAEARPMDEAPDAATGAFGTSPDGAAECLAHYYGNLGEEDFGEEDFQGDHNIVPYMEPGWNAFMEQWAAQYGGEEWPDGHSVEWAQPIPAGPAARAFDPGAPLPVSYFVTDGYGVYQVACGPTSAEPSDRWLSIAQTLELFRAERAPNGELISGPPLTSDTLLSRFITEEVEPGVTWIVYDNEHDLTGLADGSLRLLATTDGSVWSYNADGIFPIGGLGPDFPSASIDYEEDGSQPSPDIWLDAVAIGRGDTIWAVRPSEGERPALRSLELIDWLKYDGVAWALRKPAPEGGTVVGVHIDPDDTIWAWWRDDDGVTTIGRLDDIDQFYFTDVAMLESTYVAGNEDEGEAPTRQWPAIAIHDGNTWALAGDPVRLLRLVDGEWWEQPPLPEPDWQIRTENGHGLVVGSNGELWVEIIRCKENEQFPEWPECVFGLGRFDDDGWTVWDWEQEPPKIAGVFDADTGLPTAIGPDGRAWFATGSGAVWFDGSDWGRVGPQEHIYALAVAPDGSVWINAGRQRRVGDGEMDFGPTEYYVIQPWRLPTE